MLIRHSALYIAAKLLPGALGMATTALLTHLLPPSQYGRYGVALVVMNFGASLGFEWLGLAYLRLAPRQPDPARAAGTFDRLFGLLLILAALIGGACVALAPAADRAVIAAGFVLMAGYAFFEFRARFPVAGLAPIAYLRMNLLRGAAVLLVTGTTAWATRDPVWATLATAVATFAASFAGGAVVRGAGFDRALAAAALRFGMPLAASLALSSATGSLTRALVGGLGSVEALGFYTAAFALVQNTLVVLSAGLASAGFSLAVHALEAGNAADARQQLARNGTLLLAVLSPAALGMALTAHDLAATLVGPAFRAPVAALTPWLAAAAFLGGLRAHYLDHAFQLSHALRGQIAVSATAAIVTLGLDAALIPRWGPLGAAIAVTIGAACAVVHAAVAGRAAFRIDLPVAQAARIAACCAVMALAVRAMADAVPLGGLPALAAEIAAGVVAYAVAALALDVAGLRRLVLRPLNTAERPAS